MHLEPVTSDALHVFQCARVGFQVRAMSCRRGNPLPGLLRITPHVAARADARRHLGVHADALWPLGHPQVELPHVGEHGLLVAGMAGERVVLRAREPLERRLHYVAAGTEPVVVLHVVVADYAYARETEDDRCSPAGEGDLQAAWP